MRHRRWAVCIDDSGRRKSVKRHNVYPIEPDAEVERTGNLRILGDDGDVLLVEARRFLVVTPSRSKGGVAAANRIVAAALESEARLQEAGGSSRIGLRYGAVLRDIVATSPGPWSENVSFALTFWEHWVEAARGRWRVHASVKRAEWPRFARAVARGVRLGSIDDEPGVLELLERFDPNYERPRPKWFRGVFRPTSTPL